MKKVWVVIGYSRTMNNEIVGVFETEAAAKICRDFVRERYWTMEIVQTESYSEDKAREVFQ